MTIKLTNVFPPEILFSENKPCVSIYMTTHRSSPDNEQDPIRFKNLLREIEKSLDTSYKVDKEKFMEPLYEIWRNETFWKNRLDGLVILMNSNEGIMYELNREVKEMAVVSDEYHIKPLIRNYQSYDKYYALGLSQKNFKLYEGTRYYFQEVDLGDDVITDRTELLGDDVGGRVLNFGTYTGTGTSFHGHNTKNEELTKDIEKFFRYVDDFVMKNYTKVKNKPLILVSVTENQGYFRNISKNPNLLDKGVIKSYDSIDVNELTKEVWNVIEPIYLDKTKNLIDRFNNAQSKDLASGDLLQIARALDEGKVDTLIVEADRVISGFYNDVNKRIEAGDIEHHVLGDLINQFAKMCMQHKGNVVVLPKDKFPTETGCAAIYRY